MKKGIWTVILILAVIVFAGSAGYLGYRFYHSQKQEAQKEELDDQVQIDIDELLNLEFNGVREKGKSRAYCLGLVCDSGWMHVFYPYFLKYVKLG